MHKKSLILGVSGGIAVYKVPDLISRLRKKGIETEVILTRSAAEFVTPLTFREVSHHPVHLEMFDDKFQWNVEHISLAKKADLIAIIPATANIIAKMAHGLADDLLTTTVLAASCPKLVAPAMNCGMYQNPLVQRNLAILRENAFAIVGPATGELLCGDTGVGRLAELDELELNILKLLTPPDLTGETVLVTAGGTREPIDPVRYIGNRSSGKMGHAIAEAAFKRGARVFLVTTTECNLQTTGLDVISVETVSQMYDQVSKLAKQATVIIKAAAPADFRPEIVADQKIKKTADGFSLDLTLNTDILQELGKQKRNGQILVGFAAETANLAQNALAKLQRKQLDLIVGNLVNQPNVGMGAADNQITVFAANAVREYPVLPKTVVADRILDCILEYKKFGTIRNV